MIIKVKKSLLALLVLLMWHFSLSNTTAQTTRKTYLVAAEKVDCQGVAPMQCLLVRENVKTDWTVFYDPIQGFKYEEGTEYKIQVRIEKIKNPPADAADRRYVLEKVLSKKRVKKASTVQPAPTADNFNGIWQLEAFGSGAISLEKKIPRLEIQNKRATGLAGCNNFFAELSQKNGQHHFTSLGTTKKMCADMTIEQQFLAALRSTNQIQVRDDGKLVLFKGEELLMIFGRK